MYEIKIPKKGQQRREYSEVTHRGEATYERVEKRRGFSGLMKGVFVLFSVIMLSSVFTTVMIFAVDENSSFSQSMMAGVFWSREEGEKVEFSPCPEGMVYVDDPGGVFCIDRFEASADVSCPFKDPSHSIETEENIDVRMCNAVSEVDSLPWRFVARHQAEELCRRSGKRLPTTKEWYIASIGTERYYDETQALNCNMKGNSPLSGRELLECVSSAGSVSMSGNVWEWVTGDVYDGEWNERELPESGYVSMVDDAGIALSTSDEPDRSYGGAYIRVGGEGVSGVLRGGYWGSGTEGGVYAVNASVPPSFSGRAVGFRCAQSL